MSGTIALIALIAAIAVLALAIHFLVIVGPQVARRQAAAGGFWVGGKHAAQPRYEAAHRA